MPSVNVYYELHWTAGARPPIHPEPMRGRQQFNSIFEAATFFKKQAPDAQFNSLIQVITTEVDLTLTFEKYLV